MISNKYCYAVLISPSVATRGKCLLAGRKGREDFQKRSNDFYMLLYLSAQIQPMAVPHFQEVLRY